MLIQSSALNFVKSHIVYERASILNVDILSLGLPFRTMARSPPLGVGPLTTITEVKGV